MEDSVELTSFDAWKTELLICGNIIQDADDSVSWDERERRFNRYVEMLDALTGGEGDRYAFAIMASIQAENDHGAYQIAGHAAWPFGEDAYCRAILRELPRWIASVPDWAGEHLVSIANGEGTPSESTIHAFNALLAHADLADQRVINGYIAQQEATGWLRGRVGVLGR